MDIESLSDFATLAECKSFSRAAELRNITQPAFSRRIQALETAIGTALIDRRSKNFKLTAAGKRFLAHARNLIALADEAVREARSSMTHMDEPLHVVMPSSLSKTFFPEWYKTMQHRIPGLMMKVMQQKGHGAIDALNKGLADFALLVHNTAIEPYYAFDGLKTHVLGRDRMIAVHSGQTRAKGNLLMYEHGSYMSHYAESVLGKKISRCKTVFESSSTGLLKEMALAGFGTAVLQESLIKEHLADGTLTPASDITPLKCDVLLVRSANSLHKKADLLWSANTAAKAA